MLVASLAVVVVSLRTLAGARKQAASRVALVGRVEHAQAELVRTALALEAAVSGTEAVGAAVGIEPARADEAVRGDEERSPEHDEVALDADTTPRLTPDVEVLDPLVGVTAGRSEATAALAAVRASAATTDAAVEAATNAARELRKQLKLLVLEQGVSRPRPDYWRNQDERLNATQHQISAKRTYTEVIGEQLHTTFEHAGKVGLISVGLVSELKVWADTTAAIVPLPKAAFVDDDSLSLGEARLPRERV